MWLAKKVPSHAFPALPNRKPVVTKFPKNRVGAKIPTRPSERRITIHVLSVDCPACILKQFDGFYGTKRRGAVKRCLSFRSAIAHKASGFNFWSRHGIWIRTGVEQHPDNQIMCEAVGRA